MDSVEESQLLDNAPWYEEEDEYDTAVTDEPFNYSPMDLEEVDESAMFPLEYTWVWWFDKGSGKGVKTRDWAAGLVEVGEFNTVFGFWNYWRSLCDSLLFPLNSNLRLFKKGISPTWEDPANKGGGQWVVWVPNNTTANVWNEIILAVIGEQLEFSSYITGAVLAIREESNRIAIWNRQGIESDAIDVVQGQLQMLVSDIDSSILVEHKLNKVAVDFNKNFRQRKSRKRRKNKREEPVQEEQEVVVEDVVNVEGTAAVDDEIEPSIHEEYDAPLSISSSEESDMVESSFFDRNRLVLLSAVGIAAVVVLIGAIFA